MQLGNFSLPPPSPCCTSVVASCCEADSRSRVEYVENRPIVSSKFVFEIKSAILTDWRDGSSSCAEKIYAEKSMRYHRLKQSSGGEGSREAQRAPRDAQSRHDCRVSTSSSTPHSSREAGSSLGPDAVFPRSQVRSMLTVVFDHARNRHSEDGFKKSLDRCR